MCYCEMYKLLSYLSLDSVGNMYTVLELVGLNNKTDNALFVVVSLYISLETLIKSKGIFYNFKIIQFRQLMRSFCNQSYKYYLADQFLSEFIFYTGSNPDNLLRRII